MIVPTYWAEGRVREKIKGRQVTIRRFGWSDTSQADAQASADIRAREAMLRFIAGDKVIRREPKLAYNGAVGVPIREEIVARHGDTIVTRNLYGARCLNTPDVLFADIDFTEQSSTQLGCLCMAACGILTITLALFWKSFLFGFFGLIASAALGQGMATMIHRSRQKMGGGTERIARKRVDRFIAAHPDWHLRLYRTPAGFRVLAMHRTFKPDEPVTHECFKALATDPVYVQMCTKQQCFRSRVSPKPWRIGISAHMRPRPGIWPVNPERLPERARWIEDYEKTALAHAACHFVGSLGSSATTPVTLAVQKIHDELSRATTTLPLA